MPAPQSNGASAGLRSVGARGQSRTELCMSLRIGDYAMIGDTHSAALVGKNGSIDWLCLPRFDSAAVFAALLGDENNGHWQIAPRGHITSQRRRYRGDTLVLETEFETSTGVARIVAAMAPMAAAPGVPRLGHGT